MERIARSEWFETLDELGFGASVLVGTDESPTEGPYRFVEADYAPFDDVVEIRLESAHGPMRILIDHPVEVRVDADALTVAGTEHEVRLHIV